MRSMIVGLASLLLVASLGVPASAQIVINEILPNPGSEFDGAEYIELHNPTGAAVSIAGWVLTGTEFNQTCGGEDNWQFPAGASIPAGGYVVVAKDNIDADPNDDDGFRQRFGFDADFELFDADRFFENDDPTVPNMIILTNDPLNGDEIGLAPGNGFGVTCAGFFSAYEALYLYDGDPLGAGVLVDEIEYRTVDCLADACLGVGTSDNDAFPSFPGVGVSLGRDASSSDTNNSSADLFLSTNTPGAVNNPNAGPELTNLAVDNPDPLAGESVTFSIDATDADGIGSIHVVFVPLGGAADSVLMTFSAGTTYIGTVPAQPDSVPYEYFVRARDGAGTPGVSKFPDFGTRGIRWGTQAIFDVQFHSPPSDVGASALVGQAVNIEGIVTAENGLYSAGAFVISAGVGAFNSVHCFDFTSTTVVQRGDSVRVAGVVGEFFNLTQVQFFGSANVTILSSGNALPGPVALTASQLATGFPLAETLEGAYGQLTNVQVTNDNPGFGQWEVTDVTGTALIGDDAFYNYNPTNLDSLVSIDGIVTYSFSERKLEPRDDGDIVGPPIVSNIRYNPTPPDVAPSTLKITATITDNGSIATANLIYFENGNTLAPDTLAMTNTVGDEYEADLSSVVGPVIDYHIEVVDDSGFMARGPSIGTFDLYRGMVTIETVQSTFAVGTDGSDFAGLPRNVAGIVTTEPGILADNVFTIQNNWTTDPAFRGIQVFSGGSLVGQIARGDSVAVSGDVVEFFGKTQIDLHFTQAFTNYGGVGELPPFNLATTSVPPDSIGAVPAGEAWESVFVEFADAIVTNPNAGFGQYFIDNTAPRAGLETLVDDEARVSGSLTYSPTLGDSASYRGTIDFAFGEYKLQPRDDLDINDATAVDVGLGNTALSFALHQNSPNPFRGLATRIAFSIPQASEAKLRVFDVQGRLVRTLVNGQMAAGRHSIDWNGQNESDAKVAAGVYFYRLESAGESLTKKMLLLR